MKRVLRWVISFLVIAFAVVAGGMVFFNWSSPWDFPSLQLLNQRLYESTEKPKFSFIVLGENEGVNPVFEKILSEASASGAAFVVSVADLTPDGQTESYEKVQKALSKLQVPFYTVIGNNDLDEKKSSARFESYFGSPSYRSFDYQNAHFVLLNNARRTLGFDDTEQAWLQEDLDNNSKPLTFLFWHRAFGTPFENLTGDDETPVSRRNNRDTLEILQDYPIEHIFVSHVHVYFSYQLQTPSGKELPVTITGGAGATPHRLLGGEAAVDYHYLLVNVYSDRAEIEKKKIQM